MFEAEDGRSRREIEDGGQGGSSMREIEKGD
jgi:hypothetical protein